MKNLLNYQSSEYDCAPVSVTNGIRYLFEREEIYPDMIKGVMIYGMDSYNDQGEPCKYGTSPACMEFMADWLTRFGQMHNFPISCHTVSGSDVALTEGSPVLNLQPVSKITVFCCLTLFMKSRVTRNLTQNITQKAFPLSLTSQRRPTVK